MDLLEPLSKIGLPGWLVSIAAIIIIFHYTGLIKWLTERYTDSQEHSQDIEKERAHYGILQSSWREDKIGALLEEESSFIRDKIDKKLDRVESKIDKEIADKLYRFEMTISQLRDTIAVLGREAYELRKLLKDCLNDN